ncbi:MAG: ABC-type nitrate/sulfonate/bicarbonate transport system permease component [Hyphomicrobiaceae bacterium]|jgi:ABC-type nitrate/sulfonate/bicarbonate transport system permease component
MSKSATVIAATIALSAIAATAAVAGPSAAGMSGLQQSMKSAAGQNEIVHKVGKKHRKFLKGLAFGIGAAVVIGASIRHERMCRRLSRRCWNGSNNACWKYDNRC